MNAKRILPATLVAVAVVAGWGAHADTLSINNMGYFDGGPYVSKREFKAAAGSAGGFATQSGLSAEISRVLAAEATLQGNINTEATTRANADALLAPKASPTFTGNMNAASGFFSGVIAVGNSTTAGNASLYFRSAGDTSNSARILVTGGTAGSTDSGSLQIRATSINMTGTPTIGTTAAAGDNSTAIATTAGVRREIATGYKVSTLPTDARQYAGARAYVTDATACTFLGSLTGGGSTWCPVIYNGTAWIAE